MTQLLDKAIEEISKLSSNDQDTIATIILEEIIDEQKWDLAFSKSQEKLSKLADKVREDISKGKVRKMGFDEL